MRILHVMGGLPRAGCETWVMQVFRKINRDQYKFDFLVHTKEPCYYDEEARALGGRIIPCVPLSNPAKYAVNFFRILKENGPYDCVQSHVQHFSGYIMLLSSMAGVPVRITHSHTGQLENGSSPLRWSYLRGMELLVRAFSTSGLAVSTEAANALFPRNWQSDKRWSVQHGGIDIEKFRCVKDRTLVRAQLGVPADAFVVGHTGRFAEAKNHRFLIDVAREVLTIRQDAHFLLVGDGPLRVEIEDLVNKLGLGAHFTLTGVRSDIPDLLGAMDLFLFPSLYEGMPNAVLEAQACGLPCVMSGVISKEADAVPRLIRRVSLESSATSWAKAVCEHECSSRMCNDKMDQHDINSSIQRLCRFYDSVCVQGAR